MAPQEDKHCSAHSGIEENMKTLFEKVKVLDNRLWSLVILAIVQLAGIVAILMKGG
jgi:hypothetical protein